MFTIHPSSTPEMQRQEIVTGVAQSYCRVGHSTGNTNGQMIVECVQTNLVTSEEEIKGIDLRGVWRTSNEFPTSDPNLGICSMEVVIHRSLKMCRCPITHEPYILLRSGRYSLQQLR
ncbi:hypothetical protein TNCV_2993461 [Trichonephila clavipes]|nr:hypothetical protein TNCV_2993461 [Trichonephila clavipes]